MARLVKASFLYSHTRDASPKAGFEWSTLAVKKTRVFFRAGDVPMGDVVGAEQE